MSYVAIKDYEGLYEINDQGVIRSRDRTVEGRDGNKYTYKGKVLAQTINKLTGYSMVSLWKGNKGSSFTVHRLLAQAFIPNPDSKEYINHIDGNKLNNALTNLEWCTPSENSKHAYAVGLSKQAKNLTDAQVYKCLKDFLAGNTLTTLAKQYNTGLTRLTINVRNLAIKLNMEDAYNAQLLVSRVSRAKAVQQKTIAIEQWSKDGLLLLNTFPSLREASKHTTARTGAISNVLANRCKSAGGFLWKLA